MNNITFPKRSEGTIDRVWVETRDLATECAKHFNTYKTAIYAQAITEFYQKYVMGDKVEISEGD